MLMITAFIFLLVRLNVSDSLLSCWPQWVTFEFKSHPLGRLIFSVGPVTTVLKFYFIILQIILQVFPNWDVKVLKYPLRSDNNFVKIFPKIYIYIYIYIYIFNYLIIFKNKILFENLNMKINFFYWTTNFFKCLNL